VHRCHLLFLIALAIMAVPVATSQSFSLHDGDRVAFYGDSITAQRFYTRDVQDFVATRYPTLNIAFHNAGVPGDKVTGGYAGDAATRVKRDVKPWDPTVITVMLGMNDGDYMKPNPKVFADYQAGYVKLLSMLRDAAPKARIFLLENTPYDEVTHGTEFAGYMETTTQNALATPALGEREHLPVVDTFTPIMNLLRHAKAADPSYASLLVTDRIHPAEPSHWVIAATLLKAWNVDPVVTAVSMSAVNDNAPETKRTSVSALTRTGNAISWDQMDQALPLPFNFDNELMNFVLSVSDLWACDQETLRITDLQPGDYRLQIDAMKIGTFSAQQLAEGINLATMKTPMWQQARDYDGELAQRSTLEQADLLLTASTHVADRAEGSHILREGEAEFQQSARENLRLTAHHYQLTPIGSIATGGVTR